LIIKFNEIIVDTIELHSGIFIGNNNVSGWCSISKTQELVAGIKGMNNKVEIIKGVIDDSDVIDMPIKKSDLKGRYSYPNNNSNTVPVKVKSKK
jgi:hypothetical protein